MNGVMYISTPLGKVVALDPTSGREIWKYDARVDASVRFGDYTNRGVSAWRDRIVVATVDGRLIALEAATGRPVAGFGDNGSVDLRRGLRNAPFEFAEYEVTSPPAVINDLLVVGSAVADNNRSNAASGEVRAYDARTARSDGMGSGATIRGICVCNGGKEPTGPYRRVERVERDRSRPSARSGVSCRRAHRAPITLGRAARAQRLRQFHRRLRASTGAVVWHFRRASRFWDYDNASPPCGDRARSAGRDSDNEDRNDVRPEPRDRVPIFPVEERAVPRARFPRARVAYAAVLVLPRSAHRWDARPATPPVGAHARGCGTRNLHAPFLEGTWSCRRTSAARLGRFDFDRRVRSPSCRQPPAAMVQLIPATARTWIRSEATLAHRLRDTRMRVRRTSAPQDSLRPAWSSLHTRSAGRVGSHRSQDRNESVGDADRTATRRPHATAGGVVFMAATIDRMFPRRLETDASLARTIAPGVKRALTYRGATAASTS